MRAPADGEVAVTWVGHASVILQIGGKTILADPVWSHGIVGGLRRLAPPAVRWEGLPRIDAVVISHNHFDHLDRPTLERLPRGTSVIVPDGMGPWFRRRGFTQVTELDWWGSTSLGGLQVELVPAHHWSRRTLLDTNDALWGGYVLSDAQGRKVYFAGDTAYGDAFGQIGARHPHLDVAVLPIGAYAPHWFNSWAHLDPAQAVQAFTELGARNLVPMHYGTFRLSTDTASEALAWLRSEWERRGLPRRRLWDDPPGVTRRIAARPPRPRPVLVPVRIRPVSRRRHPPV